MKRTPNIELFVAHDGAGPLVPYVNLALPYLSDLHNISLVWKLDFLFLCYRRLQLHHMLFRKTSFLYVSWVFLGDVIAAESWVTFISVKHSVFCECAVEAITSFDRMNSFDRLKNPRFSYHILVFEVQIHSWWHHGWSDGDKRSLRVSIAS